MKRFKMLMFLSVFGAIFAVSSISANASEVSTDEGDLEILFSEEVESEIEENMEPVSIENPTSTYVTEDGIVVERTLTVEDVEPDSNQFTTFSSLYREVNIGYTDKRMLNTISQATLKGQWTVGLDRYQTSATIKKWNYYNISITNGKYTNKKTTIPKPKEIQHKLLELPQ